MSFLGIAAFSLLELGFFLSIFLSFSGFSVEPAKLRA